MRKRDIVSCFFALFAIGGLASASVAGCMLELDNEIACGDGYVDHEAGEECDPERPSSFASACSSRFGQSAAGRTATCDPGTCKLDVSACLPDCGNGMLDDGEECEPSQPPSGPIDDEFGVGGISCLELAPLDSDTPYAGGTARVCTTSCVWDRRPCHRCGDGQLQAQEVCDGDLDNFAAAEAYCESACRSSGLHPQPRAFVCSARCTQDCRGYEDAEAGRNCCIPNGDPVHAAFPCCGFADAGICQPGLGG